MGTSMELATGNAGKHRLFLRRFFCENIPFTASTAA